MDEFSIEKRGEALYFQVSATTLPNLLTPPLAGHGATPSALGPMDRERAREGLPAVGRAVGRSVVLLFAHIPTRAPA